MLLIVVHFVKQICYDYKNSYISILIKNYLLILRMSYSCVALTVSNYVLFMSWGIFLIYCYHLLWSLHVFISSYNYIPN